MVRDYSQMLQPGVVFSPYAATDDVAGRFAHRRTADHVVVVRG